MGDLGEGQTETLDERMWGDEDDEEGDQDGSDKEDEFGQGMDQVGTFRVSRLFHPKPLTISRFVRGKWWVVGLLDHLM